MRYVSAVSALAALQQRVILQHLLTADLTHHCGLGTTLPLIDAFLRYIHALQEAGSPSSTTIIFPDVAVVQTPLAVLETLQLSLLTSQFQRLAKLQEVLA
jgi:hypothetical protein